MPSKPFANRCFVLCVLLTGSVLAAEPAPPVASGAAPIIAAPPPVPERATQQYAQALSLLKAGRTTDAELELKQLIAAYPDLPGPSINLGLLLAHAGRLPEAEAAFKVALAINPAHPVANTELGVVERRLGKFTDAEQDYLHALAADPGYAPARLNLGILYDLYLLEPQKALDQFEQYLTLAGDNKQVAGWVSELRKRVGAPAKKDTP